VRICSRAPVIEPIVQATKNAPSTEPAITADPPSAPCTKVGKNTLIPIVIAPMQKLPKLPTTMTRM
jgi:hypothetical protein